MNNRKVTDIRSRMNRPQVKIMEAPNWFKKGKKIFEKMDPDERDLVARFIFDCILKDVDQGLKGENAGVFFKEIDRRYEEYDAMTEKNQKDCIFCEEESDAGICLSCYLKILKGSGICENFGKAIN